MKKQKLIVIVGPTASGKSGLAVRMAQEFNGEIISADSRQVYRGLDIGTGKITRNEMGGVPHHLLDITSWHSTLSAAQFVGRARRAIGEIAGHGKIPIVAGGTGFWIDALVFDLNLPAVTPNPRLRRALEKKSPARLLAILKKLDPRRAIEIEHENPRRLIRAIEIAQALGRVPRLRKKNPYDTLWIGIALPQEQLREKIKKRLDARLRSGLIQEAQRLHRSRMSWKRFHELGLEYRALALFLRGKTTKVEMRRTLERDIVRYAARQMRWWRRNHEIHWIRKTGEARTLASSFLPSFLRACSITLFRREIP